MRLLDVDLAGGVTTFSVLIRDRKTGAATFIDELALPMPGRHNALNATAAIAVAHELKVAPVDDPQGDRRLRRRQAPLHPHRRMERRDDLRRLRPPSGRDRRRAARRARRRQRQGDRGRPAASLYAPAVAVRSFARCFNDADAVIVADVYPGRRDADRRRRQAGAGRRDQRAWPPPRRRLPSPDKLAGIVSEIAKPGDYVVCLGAGNITQWAYALPGELAALEAAA